MPNWLKQSTTVTLQLGPFVDEDDGKTAETGLTIEDTDVYLSKNGAAFANPNDTNNATHDASGWYRKQLDGTDTGTLGRLIVMVHEAGALPVWREFMIVPANVYDSLVSGSDYVQVDAVQIEGGDATDAINAEADTALSDYDPPTKAELDSGLAALNDPTAAVVAAAVWDLAVSGHTTGGTFGSYINAILSDTGELQTAWTIGGRLDLILAAIVDDTGTSGVVIADSAITAAKIAADAIGASELAADAATEIADALLKRDWTSVSGEAARSVLNALRFLRNRVVIDSDAGTISIKKEDDSTEAWAGDITSDASTSPIVEIDPTT